MELGAHKPPTSRAGACAKAKGASGSASKSRQSATYGDRIVELGRFTTTPSTSFPRSKSGAVAPSVELVDDAEHFADVDAVLCFLLALVATAPAAVAGMDVVLCFLLPLVAAVAVGKVDWEEWSLGERLRVEPEGGILRCVENGQ